MPAANTKNANYKLHPSSSRITAKNPVLAHEGDGSKLHQRKNSALQKKPLKTNNEDIYKMPACLKELVDYKKSQDYLMFKQLHK